MKLPDSNSNISDYSAFNDIKIIVTDLDGTFVRTGDEIISQLQRLQNKLSEMHVTVTIATGRNLSGTKAIAKAIGMKKDTPIALYNGAVVITHSTNRVLYKKTIPNNVLIDIIKLINLNEHNILAYYLIEGADGVIKEPVFGFGRKNTIVDFNGTEIEWLDNIGRFFETDSSKFDDFIYKRIYKRFSPNLSFFPQKIVEPCAILINKTDCASSADLLRKYFDLSTDASLTDSGGDFLEIRPCGVSKGIIYSFVKDKINKIAAIGDNNNDKELLENADISVVVASASECAKKYAMYECHYNEAYGVIELIDTIKEAKKYYGGISRNGK